MDQTSRDITALPLHTAVPMSNLAEQAVRVQIKTQLRAHVDDRSAAAERIQQLYTHMQQTNDDSTGEPLRLRAMDYEKLIKSAHAVRWSEQVQLWCSRAR